MFVTTFYSFKGGVGRTMALMNVACEFAKTRKVLVVDFDLEAPGLTTFEPCAKAHGKPGLVEYLLSYLETDKAPRAADFIHHCGLLPIASENPNKSAFIDAQPASSELFVMPAGSMQAAYASQFGKIDWVDLYENRDGYLLMEDLKAQWQEMGFDYVFIDSRTGHTDSSGICTRQLPDAIVAVFFPNEENLIGLTSVVKEIQGEPTTQPNKSKLIFVASRVPRLDDEHGQLDGMLRRFRDALGYSEDNFVRIHNYDSLALIEQDVFVYSRPRTQLAAEYKNLAKLLVARNISDEQGAHAFIENIAGRPDAFDLQPDEIAEFAKIRERHSTNASLMEKLALRYYATRELELAVDAIEAAFASSTSDEALRARILGLRIRIHRALQQMDIACDSAELSLALERAPRGLILDALRLLLDARPDRLPRPSSVRLFSSAPPQVLIDVAAVLDYSRPAAKYAAEMLHTYISKFETLGPKDYPRRRGLILVLIAGGFSQDALTFDQRLASESEEYQNSIQHHFNFAMADWSAEKKPNVQYFERVTEIFETISDQEIEKHSAANFYQCIALSYAVINNEQATSKYLDLAMRKVRTLYREFSCWSYLTVSKAMFEKDCDAIRIFSESHANQPPFISDENAQGSLKLH